MKPKFEIIYKAFNHGDLSLMGLRKKYFRLVTHKVWIDPNKEFLIANSLKDHILIEHEVSISLRKFK